MTDFKLKDMMKVTQTVPKLVDIENITRIIDANPGVELPGLCRELKISLQHDEVLYRKLANALYNHSDERRPRLMRFKARKQDGLKRYYPLSYRFAEGGGTSVVVEETPADNLSAPQRVILDYLKAHPNSKYGDIFNKTKDKVDSSRTMEHLMKLVEEGLVTKSKDIDGRTTYQPTGIEGIKPARGHIGVANGRRMKILDYITEHPGLAGAEIAAGTGLPAPSSAVSSLRQQGKIVMAFKTNGPLENIGRYWIAGATIPEDYKAVSASDSSPSPIWERILPVLKANPGRSYTARELGILTGAHSGSVSTTMIRRDINADNVFNVGSPGRSSWVYKPTPEAPLPETNAVEEAYERFNTLLEKAAPPTLQQPKRETFTVEHTEASSDLKQQIQDYLWEGDINAFEAATLKKFYNWTKERS